ncbi:hypothetical protein [Candidatus Palauibacter sp.]|uniref:hypothetical protein n=1 Tax=Candidatus Palauibacter sp. TaxID=3101350 RepID=UPI003AF2DEAF
MGWLKERREQKRQEAQRQADLAEQQRAYLARVFEQVLQMAEDGVVPDVNWGVDIPFRLLKSERLYAASEAVYAEKKLRRKTVGRTSGTSVRVMKGVSVRTGGFAGHGVDYHEIVEHGPGILAVTNKHILFSGHKSARIPFRKVVTSQIDRESGLIEVVRDRASGMPEYFYINEQANQFFADLMSLMPAVEFGRSEPEVRSVELSDGMAMFADTV